MGEVSAQGGHLHMETSGTASAVQAVASVGTTFTSTWTGIAAAIKAAESKLGKGPLGKKFAEGYNPQAGAATQAAGAIPTTVQQQADIGQHCILDYVTADARAAQGFGDAISDPAGQGVGSLVNLGPQA